MRYRIAFDGNRYCIQKERECRFLFWKWKTWKTWNKFWGRWGAPSSDSEYCETEGEARELLKGVVAKEQEQAEWQANIHEWRGVEFATVGPVKRDPEEEWLVQMKREAAAFEEQLLKAAEEAKRVDHAMP